MTVCEIGVANRVKILVALALVTGAMRCWPQENPDLNTHFKLYVGLTDGQVKAIRSGRPVAKTLRSRTPAEIFVFGAVYVHATPDAYVNFSTDFDRLRKLSGYLAVGKFSTPPQFADLDGFTFDSDDINSLKECKPGNCQIQMPESSMEDIRQSIDWSALSVAEQVNQLLQKTVLERLIAYQQDGNVALGIYNDKQHPTDVAEQFKYMLSYSRAMPKYLPELYSYLLSYPSGKPTNVEDSFYWAKVKFGLKPTLRIVHVVTMQGSAANDPEYVIVEKQLYSSHYFQSALDLTFCVSDGSDAKQKGFYLIKVLGSEQSGLTGFKGSIVRKVAVDRSSSSLKKSLTAIKHSLEDNR